MFLPPTPKNPDGRPVYNTDKDIVGVTRIEKNGERNDHQYCFRKQRYYQEKLIHNFWPIYIFLKN